MINFKVRIINLLIAIDQLFWVLITLGHGSPDETISSAMYRFEQDGKLIGKIMRPVIDTLFWFHVEHCKNAYLSEKTGAHLPKVYRED